MNKQTKKSMTNSHFVPLNFEGAHSKSFKMSTAVDFVNTYLYEKTGRRENKVLSILKAPSKMICGVCKISDEWFRFRIVPKKLKKTTETIVEVDGRPTTSILMYGHEWS